MAKFWLCDVCDTESPCLDDIQYIQIDAVFTADQHGEELIDIRKEVCSKNCAIQVQLAIERAIHKVCNEKVKE